MGLERNSINIVSSVLQILSLYKIQESRTDIAADTASLWGGTCLHQASKQTRQETSVNERKRADSRRWHVGASGGGERHNTAAPTHAVDMVYNFYDISVPALDQRRLCHNTSPASLH